MPHGVSLSKHLCLLGSILSFATQAGEQSLQYLESVGFEVQAINENPILENIRLKTALTDNGVVYFDEEKDIFFVRSKPLVKAGEQLDLVDRQFFYQYAQQIPNTIDAISPNERMTAYVFTDISCAYCQTFHQNLQQYLNAGITVKFVLFPRNGLKTPVARQMATIAQSQNPLKALQDAFNGKYIEPTNINTILEQHFKSAAGLGINSTPAIMVNGYTFEGLLQPKQILAMQGQE